VSYEYEFTRNWFRRRNKATFEQFVLPVWKDRPITWLEIGVFEGQSTVWVLENILTHPKSKLVCIDPWLMMPPKWSEEKIEQVRLRALRNLKPWVDRGKCTVLRALSCMVLDRMVSKGFAGVRRGEVDVVYIDGNHEELAVLSDARYSFQLLRVGGWLIFDDVEMSRPREHHVKQGLHCFVEEVGQSVRRVFKHRHVEAWEKVDQTSREVQG